MARLAFGLVLCFARSRTPTFLVCSLESMLLDLHCRSEMWPETAERSRWKVAKKDSRELSKATLDSTDSCKST